jgi:hypothetical protein
VLVLYARVLRDVDRGPGRLDEASAAGEVVGVVVRFEDVGDLEAILLGDLEVVVYLPLWVDHRHLAPVGDDIGAAAQILVEYLSKKHV